MTLDYNTSLDLLLKDDAPEYLDSLYTSLLTDIEARKRMGSVNWGNLICLFASYSNGQELMREAFTLAIERSRPFNIFYGCSIFIQLTMERERPETKTILYNVVSVFGRNEHFHNFLTNVASASHSSYNSGVSIFVVEMYKQGLMNKKLIAAILQDGYRSDRQEPGGTLQYIRDISANVALTQVEIAELERVMRL